MNRSIRERFKIDLEVEYNIIEAEPDVGIEGGVCVERVQLNGDDIELDPDQLDSIADEILAMLEADPYGP